MEFDNISQWVKEDGKHAEELVKIIELAMQERKTHKKSVFGQIEVVIFAVGVGCLDTGQGNVQLVHW